MVCALNGYANNAPLAKNHPPSISSFVPLFSRLTDSFTPSSATPTLHLCAPLPLSVSLETVLHEEVGASVVWQSSKGTASPFSILFVQYFPRWCYSVNLHHKESIDLRGLWIRVRWLSCNIKAILVSFIFCKKPNFTFCWAKLGCADFVCVLVGPEMSSRDLACAFN